MRILFVTATRIGDAVLSTGLLGHLLRTYPAARITVVCGPVAEGVFLRMPRRERTIVLVKRRGDLHWPLLWARTVGIRWDLVVDLRGSALSFLLPARRRAVMRGGRRPGHRLGHLAGTLGLYPPPLPVAWWAEQDAARVTALLPTGLSRPLVALGPTANWSGKVWPADHFVGLFQRIERSLPGALPVVLAGPGELERSMAAPVLDGLPGAVDLAGSLSLPEAAALLSRCALFIGNDSGLMHLSAAAGAPTLGLFGPTPADEYGPVGRRTAVAIAPGRPGQAPISDLSVGAAFAAAASLLTEPAPSPATGSEPGAVPGGARVTA